MLIEKLMSGLYMGENARRILLSFARDTQLFGGSVPELLTQPGSFTTAGELAAWLACHMAVDVWRLCL
jgi:hexokinase